MDGSSEVSHHFTHALVREAAYEIPTKDEHVAVTDGRTMRSRRGEPDAKQERGARRDLKTI